MLSTSTCLSAHPEPGTRRAGSGRDPPPGDRYWYPVYEKMVEHDIPAMVHVIAACNPAFHTTGSHYLSGDTTEFNPADDVEACSGDFPSIKFTTNPHGGRRGRRITGGRYRGLAQGRQASAFRPSTMLKNVFFDTCVYHSARPGAPGPRVTLNRIHLRLRDDRRGARHRPRNAGHYYDDTKRYIDQLPLSAADKARAFS